MLIRHFGPEWNIAAVIGLISLNFEAVTQVLYKINNPNDLFRGQDTDLSHDSPNFPYLNVLKSDSIGLVLLAGVFCSNL